MYIFRSPHLPIQLITSRLDKISVLELDRFTMIKSVFSFNENITRVFISTDSLLYFTTLRNVAPTFQLKSVALSGG